MKKAKGFNILELMIVLTIIGVLSAIAVPSYKKYVNKAKLIKGYTTLSSIKMAAIDKYLSSGDWPRTLVDIAMVEEEFLGNIFDTVKVGIECGESEEFCINAEVKKSISSVDGGKINIVADSRSGMLDWKCKAVNLDASILPYSCDLV